MAGPEFAARLIGIVPLIRARMHAVDDDEGPVGFLELRKQFPGRTYALDAVIDKSRGVLLPAVLSQRSIRGCDERFGVEVGDQGGRFGARQPWKPRVAVDEVDSFRAQPRQRRCGSGIHAGGWQYLGHDQNQIVRCRLRQLVGKTLQRCRKSKWSEAENPRRAFAGHPISPFRLYRLTPATKTLFGKCLVPG